jgi:hypothetical protein
MSAMVPVCARVWTESRCGCRGTNSLEIGVRAAWRKVLDSTDSETIVEMEL